MGGLDHCQNKTQKHKYINKVYTFVCLINLNFFRTLFMWELKQAVDNVKLDFISLLCVYIQFYGHLNFGWKKIASKHLRWILNDFLVIIFLFAKNLLRNFLIAQSIVSPQLTFNNLTQHTVISLVIKKYNNNN